MSARIHPTATLDSSVILGEDVEIGPFCTLGPGVAIGARTRLIAHVYIERETAIGVDGLIHPYAILGQPPQDKSYKGEPTRLEIGDRCHIREQATLHRGTMRGRGVTKVGDGLYMMANAHVAHDCIVGDQVVLAHGATLGGHVQVGDRANLGGLCAVHQMGRVGAGAMVGGVSLVSADLIPYGIAVGVPADLRGLNVIGLKRRGVTAAAIKRLRAAYHFVFNGEGVFAERLAHAHTQFSDLPEAQEILAFMTAPGAKRRLMRPPQGAGAGAPVED
jgi:UDP-N-acetylglucosamine acyltransferase